MELTLKLITSRLLELAGSLHTACTSLELVYGPCSLISDEWDVQRGERIFSPPGNILGGRKYHGTRLNSPVNFEMFSLKPGYSFIAPNWLHEINVLIICIFKLTSVDYNWNMSRYAGLNPNKDSQYVLYTGLNPNYDFNMFSIQGWMQIMILKCITKIHYTGSNPNKDFNMSCYTGLNPN